MTILPGETPKKLGLVIDLDICVGCHACAVNCKEWNTSGHSAPLTDWNAYSGTESADGDDAGAWGVWFNRVHTYEVGDAPESILLSHVDISGDWSTWKESEPVLVMSPERAWEGANSPTEPSVRSSAYGLVNQLRDPALLVEGNDVYLFYAIGGESGIAVARVDF